MLRILSSFAVYAAQDDGRGSDLSRAGASIPKPGIHDITCVLIHDHYILIESGYF
jgi:hypothetical protein